MNGRGLLGSFQSIGTQSIIGHAYYMYLDNYIGKINFFLRGAKKIIIKGGFHMKLAGFSARFCWLLSFQGNTKEV